MPSTVADVFTAAGLKPAGAVRWGTPIPETAPGVYVVAVTDAVGSVSDAMRKAPLDAAAFEHLLRVREELRLDGARPSGAELATRLRAFWLGDEVVVYIGLAGTSLRTRVGQYYKTPLGAKKPHAGGWWLKALAVLDDLWVHYAATPDNDRAETSMLRHFADRLSSESRSSLHDSDDPAPFANLRTGRGSVKKHGIKGATGEMGDATQTSTSLAPQPDAGTRAVSGASRPEEVATTSPSPRSTPRGAGTAPSQKVSAKDIDAGQVRFPRPAKRLLPAGRDYVAVQLRGSVFERVRWDPRIGADKERSGLLSFGKGKLDRLVDEGEVLTLTAYADGRLELG